MIKLSPKKSNKLAKIIIGVISSITLSFFALYISGNLQQIQAYNDPANIPALKLFIIKSTLFLTMSIALYFLIQEFLTIRLKQNVILFSVLAISFLLSYQVISIPDNEGHIVGFSYILVGNYLRDVHSINIYFMDWASWAVTMVLYMTSIFSALFFKGINKFLPDQFVDKK